MRVKVKVSRNRSEQTQVVPGRLRTRIFLKFGTTRVVGRQPYAPAVCTPGEIPGNHFQGLSRPHGIWFRRREPQKKKSPVTPLGIDPETVRLVAKCLNHYATPVLKIHKCWGSNSERWRRKFCFVNNLTNKDT